MLRSDLRDPVKRAGPYRKRGESVVVAGSVAS